MATTGPPRETRCPTDAAGPATGQLESMTAASRGAAVS